LRLNGLAYWLGSRLNEANSLGESGADRLNQRGLVFGQEAAVS
jgi:hypothetical protein